MILCAAEMKSRSVVAAPPIAGVRSPLIPSSSSSSPLSPSLGGEGAAVPLPPRLEHHSPSPPSLQHPIQGLAALPKHKSLLNPRIKSKVIAPRDHLPLAPSPNAAGYSINHLQQQHPSAYNHRENALQESLRHNLQQIQVEKSYQSPIAAQHQFVNVDGNLFPHNHNKQILGVQPPSRNVEQPYLQHFQNGLYVNNNQHHLQQQHEHLQEQHHQFQLQQQLQEQQHQIQRHFPMNVLRQQPQQKQASSPSLNVHQYHGRPDYEELQRAVGLLNNVGRQRGSRDTGEGY